MASALVKAREFFAEDLWRFGEDELAVTMLMDTDDETYRRVMHTAGDPQVLATDQRQSWSSSEMAALGAVEVLTGSPRPLKRKRRRPESALADFWLLVGPEQDTRTPHDDGLEAAGRVLDGRTYEG